MPKPSRFGHPSPYSFRIAGVKVQCRSCLLASIVCLALTVIVLRECHMANLTDYYYLIWFSDECYLGLLWSSVTLDSDE